MIWGFCLVCNYLSFSTLVNVLFFTLYLLFCCSLHFVLLPMITFHIPVFCLLIATHLCSICSLNLLVIKLNFVCCGICQMIHVPVFCYLFRSLCCQFVIILGFMFVWTLICSRSCSILCFLSVSFIIAPLVLSGCFLPVA